MDGAGPGTNAGGLDAFLSKYDSSGNVVFTRQIETSADEYQIKGVAVDSGGNITPALPCYWLG